MKLLASLVLLAVAATSLAADSAAVCDDQATLETEKAFKNCVESAQTSIVIKVSRAPKGEDAGLCDDLSNMLSVCQGQMESLAACKGREHADKIKKLHLSVTADIVKAIKKDSSVEKCSVFKKKTAIKVDKNGGVTLEGSGRGRGSQTPNDVEPSGDGGGASGRDVREQEERELPQQREPQPIVGAGATDARGAGAGVAKRDLSGVVFGVCVLLISAGGAWRRW